MSPIWAVVGHEVKRAVAVPLGVQVLAGANQCALAVALACGASFVRVEGFVFAHVADEGIIESSAGTLLRYRRAIGADSIRPRADLKKKHSAHAITADVSLVETAKAAEFFLVDGVIVTGVATGQAADASEVQAVARAVGVPTLVGSGVTLDNLHDYRDAVTLISRIVNQARWRVVRRPGRVAGPCAGACLEWVSPSRMFAGDIPKEVNDVADTIRDRAGATFPSSFVTIFAVCESSHSDARRLGRWQERTIHTTGTDDKGLRVDTTAIYEKTDRALGRDPALLAGQSRAGGSTLPLPIEGETSLFFLRRVAARTRGPGVQPCDPPCYLRSRCAKPP